MKFQNVFTELEVCQAKIVELEARILELEQKLDRVIRIERNHLVRVKNHEEVSDEFIVHGRKYQDLTPEKAWKLYNNQDFNFILVDVSEAESHPESKLPEALHIPWSEFPERFTELQSRTTPILIISEDGTTSVLACEFLAERGFYNCNNVSGGHKFWKGFRLKDVSGRTA